MRIYISYRGEMTSGNDLLEFEQKNHAELIERWAEKHKVKLDKDSFENYENNASVDEAYWDFVQEYYDNEMAYYSEKLNEMRC